MKKVNYLLFFLILILPINISAQVKKNESKIRTVKMHNRLKSAELPNGPEDPYPPAIKSPRHGRNSIFYHRRRASKSSNPLVILNDYEFDKLFKNSISVHKKKRSERLQYLKYKHNRGFSSKNVYQIDKHLKKESSIDFKLVQKHKKRPSRKGEYEDVTKF